MVTRADRRRGGTSIGCLFGLLLLAATFYVGITLGRPWFRYQQFRDEMQSAARFGSTLSDSAILVRLRAVADTIGLPKAAKRLTIIRLEQPTGVTISAKWDETVKIVLYGEKTFHFAPKVVEGP